MSPFLAPPTDTWNTCTLFQVLLNYIRKFLIGLSSFLPRPPPPPHLHRQLLTVNFEILFHYMKYCCVVPDNRCTAPKLMYDAQLVEFSVQSFLKLYL